MEPFDQVPFEGSEFVTNSEPRCPCLLLLDTSASMQGDPIRELNDGLITFKDQLAADSLAAKRAEVAIITFGPPRLEADFQTAEFFYPPTLTASGDTPMGAAIEMGIDLVTQRKEAYNANGVDYYRPWIFLFTDGAPTEPTEVWRRAADAVKRGEEQNAFSFFTVGVEGANMEVLSQIATRTPLKLKGLDFRKFFKWLSNTMQQVSRSQPEDKVPLDNPAAPDGWATV